MRAGYIQFRTMGFKELDEALWDLPRAIAARALLKALKQAAEPAIRKGQATAPIGTTLGIINSIGARRMKRRRYGVEISIGPNAPHAHLIEFGTKPRVTVIEKKGVLSDGTNVYGVRIENGGLKPNRFWTRAWEATKFEVLSDFRELVWAALLKEAKKLGRKAARGMLNSAEKDMLG